MKPESYLQLMNRIYWNVCNLEYIAQVARKNELDNPFMQMLELQTKLLKDAIRDENERIRKECAIHARDKQHGQMLPLPKGSKNR